MRACLLLLLCACQGETVVGRAPPQAGGCDSTRGPKMVRVDTYCIDETEVTQSQFREFASAPDRAKAAPPFCSWNTMPAIVPADTAGDALPVGNVNFCDAHTFCGWAGKRLCGRIGAGSLTAAQMTDPAVSQWYRACSSNGTRLYPYGDTYAAATCPTEGPVLQPPKSYPECRSTYGVYDMNGNMEEWIDSCQAPAPGADTLCSAAGGGNDDKSKASCKFTDVATAKSRYDGLGFRCCRDL